MAATCMIEPNLELLPETVAKLDQKLYVRDMRMPSVIGSRNGGFSGVESGTIAPQPAPL